MTTPILDKAESQVLQKMELVASLKGRVFGASVALADLAQLCLLVRRLEGELDEWRSTVGAEIESLQRGFERLDDVGSFDAVEIAEWLEQARTPADAARIRSTAITLGTLRGAEIALEQVKSRGGVVRERRAGPSAIHGPGAKTDVIEVPAACGSGFDEARALSARLGGKIQWACDRSGFPMPDSLSRTARSAGQSRGRILTCRTISRPTHGSNSGTWNRP